MNFNIVDIERVLNQYNIYSEIILFDELKDYVVFYTGEIEGKFYIITYNKKTEKVLIEDTIILNKDVESIGISHFDCNNIVYSLIVDDVLLIYEYDRILRESLLKIQINHGFLSCKIDKDYYIVDIEGESYLVDLNSGSYFILEDEIFKDTFYYDSRKVKLDGKTYFAHIKYKLSNYDLDYYFKYPYAGKVINGVYLLALNEFIESIKLGKQIEKIIIMENTDDSYINGVDSQSEDKFHFINIRSDRKVELYEIKNEEKHLETTLLIEDKFSYEGLFVGEDPIEIGIMIDSYGYREYRKLYPDTFEEIVISDSNDYPIKFLKDYILYSGWTDEYNYLKLVNRYNKNVFLNIIGDGIILNDNRTVLIYNNSYLKTYSRIIDKKDVHPTYLKEIFDLIEDKQLDYNWLITDFEAHPDDREIKEILSKDVLWLSGEELTRLIEKENFQWIWGVFTGFSKHREYDEIKDYIPFVDGFSGYWEEKVNLQHPDALVEIVAFDSSRTLFITEEDELVRIFDRNIGNLLDLEFDNRIIEKQIYEVENIIKGMDFKGDIRNKAIEIWNILYREIHLNLDIDIDEREIEKFIK